MSTLRATAWLALLASGCSSPDPTASSPPAPTPAPWTSDTSAPGPTPTTIPQDTAPPAGVRVVVTPGTPCADPSRRLTQPFSVTTLPYVEPVATYGFDGTAVAAGDFDRDGMIEALVLGGEQEEYIEQRAAGVFTAVEGGYMDPSIDLSGALGAAVADYDADGDLDIFVSRYGKPNVLLQNDGAGFFVDTANAAGVRGVSAHLSAAAAWTDVDNDGDLDLYVAGNGVPFGIDEEPPPADPDYLYANDGDGTFRDMSGLLPSRVHEGHGFVPSFLDLDDDGWRDLYLVNDYGGRSVPCLLVWNRGGTFELDNGAVSLDRTIPGMGLGIGDVNEDGLWDLMIPAWGEIHLVLSEPALGIWVDYSDALGLVPDAARNQVVGWGAELADVNNDTLLDAVVMFGEVRVTGGLGPPNEPNGLWLQGASGQFTDVAGAWGFDSRGIERGLGIVDLNGDGWLDAVVPSQSGPTRIYLASCGEEAWLEVALQMPGTANPDAIGATVEVRIGDRTLRRPMMAGGTGYGTGLPPIVHFGLGAHERIDQVVVRWPDGEYSTVSAEPRTRVTIVRD